MVKAMDEADFESTGHVYTPSELNQEVKLSLEACFPRVLIEAEVSNLSRPASGHLYFSLKDEAAQVRCAMFRSAALRCRLNVENGKKVLARGRISLYEPRGEYQFIVDGMRDAGEGRLQQLFEQLKTRLEAEGLFEAARKKALPPYPWRIGVITSPSGAAIRDILQVLERRWPVAQVRLYPVSVQGSEAPGEIRAALASANKEGWAEVLILGRGGGSLEDLQAFNEETVARCVAASGIPIICAVGHETDFSICDFVADLRAPTPSAAAELATPDRARLNAEFTRYERMLEQRLRGQMQRRMQHLDYLAHRLVQRDPAHKVREQGKHLARLEEQLYLANRRALQDARARLSGLCARLGMQHPHKKLENCRQRLRDYQGAFDRSLARKLESSHNRLLTLARTLHAVSPLATMERGYAVLSAADSSVIISTVEQVAKGDRIAARLANGSLNCTVDSVSAEAFDPRLT